MLYEWFSFFRFVQILFNLARSFAARHEKSFVPAFRKVSILKSLMITYLIALSLEIDIVVLEKSLEFWNHKSVRTLSAIGTFSSKLERKRSHFAKHFEKKVSFKW